MVTFHHVAIGVADLTSSIALFRALGFTTVEPWEYRGQPGADLVAPDSGARLELAQAGGALSGSRLGHLALRVTDLDAARAAVLTHGGTVEAMSTAGARFNAATADGLRLEIVAD